MADDPCYQDEGRAEMTNAETYEGTPIPDPDPTGEYPNGWHPAVEPEELIAAYEKEIAACGHSAYEVSLLVQGFLRGLSVRTLVDGAGSLRRGLVGLPSRCCVGLFREDEQYPFRPLTPPRPSSEEGPDRA